MMDSIVIAVIGSGALSALISGLFGIYQSRKNKQKVIEEDLKTIKQQLETAEKDALRTQLIVMIKLYPHETTDILRLAEYYFERLDGNWIMSNIFSEWCKMTGTNLPAWFKES